MTPSNDQQSEVIVAGADWCGDTRATLAYLQELGVPFNYVNVDEDESAADWVREQNSGKLKLPTVDVGGLILSIPDAEQLQAALDDRNLLGDGRT